MARMRIIAAAAPAADHPADRHDVRAKARDRAPTILAAPAASPGPVAAAVTMMARAASIETAAAGATPMRTGIAGLTA